MKRILSIIALSAVALLSWGAAIPGIRVTGPIVPSDTADTYPTHEDVYGKGGLVVVSNTAARDAIPSARRKAGMLVTLQSDGRSFRLNSDLTNWTEVAAASTWTDIAESRMHAVRDDAAAAAMPRAIAAAYGRVWNIALSSYTAIWSYNGTNTSWSSFFPGPYWGNSLLTTGGHSNRLFGLYDSITSIRAMGGTVTGTFYAGETATNTSGASGTVLMHQGTNVVLWASAGTWATNDVITGTWSGASVNPTSGGASVTRTLIGEIVPATRLVIVPGGSGLFRIGETVSQATSGASGTVAYFGTWLGVTNMWVSGVSGTFDGSNTLTGGTSGATRTPSAAEVTFSPVLHKASVTAGALTQDNLKWVGGSNWLWATYVTTGTSQLWGSTNDAVTWSMLFDATSSIRHFHSLEYSPQLDTVLLLTGDSGTDNGEVSILMGSPAADILTNSATWATRWALDGTASSARAAYLTTGAGTNYCLTAGTQAARAVGLVLSADGTKAYWIPDTSTEDPATLDAMARVFEGDLTTRTVRAPDGLNVGKIPGWNGARLPNGMIVYQIVSEYGSTASYRGGDEYIRLVGFIPGRDRIYHLGRTRRADWYAPLLGSINRCEKPTWMLRDDGSATVWLSSRNTLGSHNGPEQIEGGLVLRVSDNVLAVPSGPTLYNLVTDSRFSGALSGEWTSYQATLTITNTPIDAVRGHQKSLHILPTSSGGSYVQWALPAARLPAVLGKWLTIQAEWYGSGANVTMMEVEHSGSIPTRDSKTRSGAQPASWLTWTMHYYVPTNATSLAVRFYPRTSGSDTTPKLLSNLRVVPMGAADWLPDIVPQ